MERQRAALHIHRRGDEEGYYHKTVITKLTGWTGVGKSQLKDEAKRLKRKDEPHKEGTGTFRLALCSRHGIDSFNSCSRVLFLRNDQ